MLQRRNKQEAEHATVLAHHNRIKLEISTERCMENGQTLNSAAQTAPGPQPQHYKWKSSRPPKEERERRNPGVFVAEGGVTSGRLFHFQLKCHRNQEQPPHSCPSETPQQDQQPLSQRGVTSAECGCSTCCPPDLGIQAYATLLGCT